MVFSFNGTVFQSYSVSLMVLVTRLELVQCCHRRILSPLCLPIPPHQQLLFVCPNCQPSFRFAIYPSTECIYCIWWKMSESNRYPSSQGTCVTVTLHSPYGWGREIRTPEYSSQSAASYRLTIPHYVYRLSRLTLKRARLNFTILSFNLYNLISY